MLGERQVSTICCGCCVTCEKCGASTQCENNHLDGYYYACSANRHPLIYAHSIATNQVFALSG